MPFLSLVTLNFKLLRARDRTRILCEFGANPFSGSGDISYKNKKYHRLAAPKNRTSGSSLRAVKTKALQSLPTAS